MKRILGLMFFVSLFIPYALFAGSGTIDDPYTVAQARALEKGSAKQWVQGYIVGARYDNFDTWTNDFAISIADDPGETQFENCIQIVLDNSTGFRAIWGLGSNPAAFGKQIKAHGYRDDYGGAANPSFEGVDEIIEVTGGGDETVAAPAFDPPAGTYTSPQNVTITSTTDGAVIYYTTNGDTPDISSNQYVEPIPVDENTTIKAIAYLDDDESVVATAVYRVVISSSDASLPYEQYFTIDEGNFEMISIEGDQVWNWKTFDNGCMVMNGYQSGSNANVDYLISPTFNFSNYTNIELNFREAINYLTSYDDLQVVASTDYEGDVAAANWTELAVTGRSAGDNWDFLSVDPVSLDAYAGEPSLTIAFFYTSTTEASSTWEISYVAITGEESVPVAPDNHVSNFAAVAGSITQSSIELAWEENDGDVVPDGYLITASTGNIVAPVDGVDPDDDIDLSDGEGNVKVPHGTASYLFENCAPGTEYNFAIYPFASSGESIVYKAEDAPAASAATLVQLIAPVISPEEGDYLEQVEVEITCETPDAEIYYVLNGDIPSADMIMYEGAFLLVETTTVKAVSVLGTDTSEVATATYTIVEPIVELVEPVITPEEGEYFDSVQVTITCATQDASVFYSINGGDDIEYSERFTLYESATIEAYSTLNDESSDTISAQYTIVPSPVEIADLVFTPESGEYADSVEIAISCETDDVTIYYLIDGDIYSDEAMVYTGPFKLFESAMVSAVAVLDSDSSMVSIVEYIITVTPPEIAAPEITPVAGEYESEVEVEISCSTEGAVIYYTINGDTPDENATPYENSFVIDQSTSIKAVAYLDGFASEITEVSYTITEPVVPVDVATLAELRAGEEDGTVYTFTGTAVVTFAMDFRGQKYIQDETAAILIDDDNGIITSAFEMGDGLTNLTGTLYTHFGLLQFMPMSDAENVSDHGIEIAAQEVEVSDFVDNFEDYESKLIKLNNVQFEESGDFANGTNYIVGNGESNTVVRSHFYNVDYIGTAIPDKAMNITGIALWHYDEAKIVPRMLSDFEEASSVSDLNSIARVYSYNNKIVVDNPEYDKSKIAVYSIDGRRVKEKQADSNIYTIEMEKAGMYIVVINVDNMPVQSRKVIIK
jgi:hypothetical protein